jgi:crotonobetainyl-CoA:carnitine CoA-transferase CaiB-like acyl-CoA transferase
MLSFAVAYNGCTVNTPLHGLKVLELARVLAGPWIGQTLADLGADVIKVESPEGDDTRRWGPPFVRQADGSSADAAYFHCCNRGKRSVVADFRTPEGRDLVLELAQRSDVLIENFKVGALAAYGLDYPALQSRNPRLVYCSVTGFGQTGPYAARAGYDLVIQGMGGLMDITGEPDRPPQKVGVALADIITGVYGVVAIQSALAQRERTGRGMQIDMSLLDTMVGILANQGLNYLVSGNSPQRLGNAHPNIVPYQAFAALDGTICVAIGNDAQFQRFCALIDLPQLAADPRFANNPSRVAHREVLIALLATAVGQRRRDELLQALEREEIPAGPVNSIAEVFADPQVIARAMRIDLGPIPSIRTPIRFSHAELALSRPAPRLGEHTAEVLEELAGSQR